MQFNYGVLELQRQIILVQCLLASPGSCLALNAHHSPHLGRKPPSDKVPGTYPLPDLHSSFASNLQFLAHFRPCTVCCQRVLCPVASSALIFSHLTTTIMHVDLPRSCCTPLFTLDTPLARFAPDIHFPRFKADKHNFQSTFHHHAHATASTLRKQHNTPCLADSPVPLP